MWTSPSRRCDFTSDPSLAMSSASDRHSSVLATFISQNNLRGFIFDVLEVIDLPAGSLESILAKAGKATVPKLKLSRRGA